MDETISGGPMSARPPVAREAVAPGVASRVPSIEGYEILGRLGSGTMGTTYRARLVETGSACVLKVCDFRGSAQAPVFFIREVQAGLKLRHPNIVRVLDFGESGGVLYLAMEYVEGGSLLDRIARGPLTPAEAVAHLGPLADALDHAAARRFIHRDIKPANILLDAGSVPRLGDFGLAKLLAEWPNATFTTSGEARGTPLYMAPEVILPGKEVDARADLYSLGATYYHALVGEPPFRSGSLGEIFRMVAEHEPARLEERNPAVPTALADVIRRLMRKNAAERFQSAAELAAAVRRLDGGRTPGVAGV